VKLFSELKRRNVIRVGIAYVVAAWVMLQVADLVFEAIKAPDWVLQALLTLLVLGFFAAVIIAWAYELTPEGVKRQSAVDPGSSVTQQTAHKLNRITIGLLIVVVALVAVERFVLPQQPLPQQAPEPGPTITATKRSVGAADEAPGTGLPEDDAAKPGANSIAVLPFVNMSPDPENEYFSDGISEELLNLLVRVEGLRVPSRTSSFAFKGLNADIGEIARQLDVGHVLEGSVRKAGNRVRVTAQLIDVATDTHLWSDTYDRELEDIFAIQDEIAAHIVDALKLVLAPRPAVGAPTGNLEAYNLYLQGRFFLAKRGSDNMHAAISLFEQAVALDPDFTDAWSGLSFTLSILPGWGSEMDYREVAQRNRQAVERALELDPSHPEALIASAFSTSITEWNWKAAVPDFERAYRSAPRDARVLNLYGDFLTITGDFDKAEAVEKTAMALDPMSAVHPTDLAFHYLLRGRANDALPLARRAVDLQPDDYIRIDVLIYAPIESGAFEEARSLIEQTVARLDVDRGFAANWWCIYHYYRGDETSLRTALEDMVGIARSESGSNLNFYTLIALYTLRLDGVEAAMPWLEAAYDTHEYLLIYPEAFFLPEQVSDDPAWLAFWQRPGLVELVEIRRSRGQQGPIGHWQEWSPR
jgi:TolB-like protein/cytochrome c-type biogenesis protein CcmH/NrfG